MNKSDLIKKRLADALKKLCSKKPLDKISISDITNMCGINRSTFYYHFLDKNDLIEWIFHEEITKFFTTAKQDIWLLNTQHLLEIFHDNQNFYYQALKITDFHNLRNIIFNITVKKANEYLDNYLSGKELDTESRSFITRFYAHAFTEMNIEYILSGAAEPPQRAALRYYDVCEPSLRLAIDNCLKRNSDKNTVFQYNN